MRLKNFKYEKLQMRNYMKVKSYCNFTERNKGKTNSIYNLRF